ncbi:UDP-N-acetylmuramate--L-alanine ligase [Deferrisoma camini]|uniref:UDP-N-acetylmuramate--L-alanine ligase n=1 Tax=Deferrisoma camini TaxID=1035120 RepID=UPI00046CE581
MYRKDHRIHFVGIGGIGMSGIAEVLLNLGYPVSGSDLRDTPITRRLAGLGARIHQGHAAEHVGDATVVVTSSAVGPDNPEVVEAHRRGVPVIPRAEMLAELMRMKYAVAVAGAHGKTTTTSMVGAVLSEAGLDPTVVVGGRLRGVGTNAVLGRGEFLVAEADESDGSFLTLVPTVAVITNIDREHMNHYGSEQALEQAFVDFANKVPFYGAVVLCLDDPRVQEVLPAVRKRVIAYGLSAQAEVRARDVSTTGARTRFEVVVRGAAVGRVDLAVPGVHNVRNALAAVAVADELGVDPGLACRALCAFEGVERRSQVVGEAGGVIVVDDYGHHPTEIQAVLAALKEAYGRRVVAVFQPHRYSRTADLMDRFATCFYDADTVLVTDIYPAGEDPVEGVTAGALAEGLRTHGHRDAAFVGPLDAVPDAVVERARPGDLVVTLGAGSIGGVGARIVARLAEGDTHGENSAG